MQCFGVPEDLKIRRKWLQGMSKKKIPTKNTKVCSRHFKEDDFIPSTLQKAVRKLKPEAVPSVFPGMPEWNDSKNDHIQSKGAESVEESDDQSNCDDDDDHDGVTSSENDIKSEKRFHRGNEESNEADKEKLNEISQHTIPSSKIMVVEPITEINKIDAVMSTASESLSESEQGDIKEKIQTLPFINIKRVSPNSNDTVAIKKEIETCIDPSVHNRNNMIEVQPIAKQSAIKKEVETYIDPSAHNSNNIIVVQPITEQKSIEDIISIKTELNENSSPFDNSTAINLFDNKSFALNIDEEGLSYKAKAKHNDVSQTRVSNAREKKLVKRIKSLRLKLKRRVTAFKQLRAVLQLIKQCKNFTQIQQVLAIPVKRVPEGLNCDGVIIAEP